MQMAILTIKPGIEYGNKPQSIYVTMPIMLVNKKFSAMVERFFK